MWHTKLDPGNEPTPDWRVKMSDGRVADIEVTLVTDGQARMFWDHLTGKDNLARVWAAPGLAHDWPVAVTVTSPMVGAPDAKGLVDALGAVLRAAEDGGDTPEEMKEIAQERLISPERFLDRCPWVASWQEAHREGIAWEDWVKKSSGYWYPLLLLDHSNGQVTDHHVSVLKAPTPTSDRAGTVRTYPSGSEGGFEHEALLSAIQDGIDRKTAKGQLDSSPDQNG